MLTRGYTFERAHFAVQQSVLRRVPGPYTCNSSSFLVGRRHPALEIILFQRSTPIGAALGLPLRGVVRRLEPSAWRGRQHEKEGGQDVDAYRHARAVVFIRLRLPGESLYAALTYLVPCTKHPVPGRQVEDGVRRRRRIVKREDERLKGWKLPLVQTALERQLQFAGRRKSRLQKSFRNR